MEIICKELQLKETVKVATFYSVPGVNGYVSIPYRTFDELAKAIVLYNHDLYMDEECTVQFYSFLSKNIMIPNGDDVVVYSLRAWSEE